MKKKIEEKERIIKEKDETVAIKDQQIEVKEKIIVEREEIISGLTKQLEDKNKLMEEMSEQGAGDGPGDAEVSKTYKGPKFLACEGIILGIHTDRNEIRTVTVNTA